MSVSISTISDPILIGLLVRLDIVRDVLDQAACDGDTQMMHNALAQIYSICDAIDHQALRSKLSDIDEEV